MPKKIYIHSAIHQFLTAARQLGRDLPSSQQTVWKDWIDSMRFDENGKRGLLVHWTKPAEGSTLLDASPAKLYQRGDAASAAGHLAAGTDAVQQDNRLFFMQQVRNMSGQIGVDAHMFERTLDSVRKRLANEEDFHDAWADSVDVASIDIYKRNEALTAPEMRCITTMLGDIKGKQLLDVGCGLGEASVYFAIMGAKVTSSDLSSGMLRATEKLAALNGVTVQTHQAASEHMNLGADEKFDIIYVGNLFHHVNIAQTIEKLKPHLKNDGILVSWDPIAYNPIINLYRTIATETRTPDEHPLTVRDVALFRKNFGHVETRFFWLTTLLIFILMVIVQHQNPNKERFWKKVIEDSDKWAWLYRPLERLDAFLLNICPPLKWLCWNVVIVARKPIDQPDGL